MGVLWFVFYALQTSIDYKMKFVLHMQTYNEALAKNYIEKCASPDLVMVKLKVHVCHFH